MTAKFLQMSKSISNLKLSEGGNKCKYHTQDPQTYEATITIYIRSGQMATDSVITFKRGFIWFPIKIFN